MYCETKNLISMVLYSKIKWSFLRYKYLELSIKKGQENTLDLTIPVS